MIIDRNRKILAWVGWGVIFPLGLYFSYLISPPQSSLFSFDFFVFILMLIAVALIPININNLTLTITQWISLVVFLEFGLFAELISGQVLILFMMISRKLSREEFTKFAINSQMFALLSILSGLVYYALGGTHEYYSISDLSFLRNIAIYLIVYFLINHGLVFIGFRMFYKMNRSAITLDMLWEGLSTLIVYPIGASLYILYNEIGLASCLLIGLPVISMLLILKFYNNSRETNRHLQKVVEVGHLLTARLEFDEVLDIFVENVTKVIPTDYLYVLDNIDGMNFQVIRSYEPGEAYHLNQPSFNRHEGIVGETWKRGEAILFSEKKEWEKFVSSNKSDHIESILAIPMIKNDEITGMIFIASSRKRIYEKFHLMIVDILCSYLAIALDNARHYEVKRIQSERDSLTNLYNARMITEKLQDGFAKLQQGHIENLSLLLIDIDHFKRVNDTYGHESGNEILREFAEVLKTIVGTKGILGRYGGEEFTIILPNYSKEEAMDFAERIRTAVEDRVFVLYDDLAEVRRKINIHITTSIGIANAPEDTDDPMSLISFADRALYIGAKQVGRNKVAGYVG